MYVEKRYKIDYNYFSNTYMNKHDIEKIEVPSSPYPTGSDKKVIDNGWNYTRYQVTIYYESDQGYH